MGADSMRSRKNLRKNRTDLLRHFLELRVGSRHSCSGKDRADGRQDVTTIFIIPNHHKTHIFYAPSPFHPIAQVIQALSLTVALLRRSSTVFNRFKSLPPRLHFRSPHPCAFAPPVAAAAVAAAAAAAGLNSISARSSSYSALLPRFWLF